MVDWTYAWRIFPDLLKAALTANLVATLGGMGIAVAFGMLIAICRMSSYGAISAAARGFIEFVRGTPLLIQLFFLFYLLPRVGISLSAMLTGIVGLGLNYSAYVAEVYRAGIEGVDKGQWEASTALNFSGRHTWRRIILPQAIPPVVPVLGNYLLTMFKETALLATITVRELLGTAFADAQQTFRYLEALTLVGIIFMGLSYPSAVLLRWLEKRLASE